MSILRTNRPLNRYWTRFYYQLRGGSAWSHASDWMPGLSLEKPSSDGSPGTVSFRGTVLAPLFPYPAPQHNRDELVIVGSGPSLREQARDRIPISSALLVNGAITLLEASDLKPFAILVEDERFIWRHRQMLIELVPSETDCYFSTPVLRALAETMPEWLATQRLHHLDFVHRPYNLPRRNHDAQRELAYLKWADDGKTAISLSPEKGIVPAGSVAVSAMQLALALKPARIGFAGIDLNNSTQPRFYETENATAMSRIAAAQKTILAALDLAIKQAENQSITVENYSPASALNDIGTPYSPRLEIA